MKRLSDFFYKRTNFYISVIFTVIMISYASLVMGGKSECFADQLNEGQKVLGLKFGYSYEYAFSFFNSLNNEGLICYKRLILVWDNIFPLLYGTMYIFWISLIYRNIEIKNLGLRSLNIFPVFHILMDWTENFYEINLINQFLVTHDISKASVDFSSFVSMIKWSCSIITYAILISGLSILIFKKFTKKLKL